MTSILPSFPRFVMTVFEPISLIAGCAAPFVSASYFVSEQIPNSPSVPLDANTSMVAYQLGNIYLLLAMVGIAVLYTTTEAAVVRNYVIALWLADISHVGITCYVMPYEQLVDVASWNAMTWGNIGATVFLFSVRTGYLLGLFGPDRQPVVPWRKLQ
ncbi:hypothetical protein DL98DRAFT_521772 [Cadophora sp. DSE1049]|nr:hypothetical protein DL98DRAFT_521772 [Cadophora sp. DSE1049]